MAERTGNIYGISTANVLDKKSIHLAGSMGIGKHLEMASKAGVEGIELWPASPIVRFQISTSHIPRHPSAKVLSAHQTPRSEELWQVPHDLSKIQPIMIMPKANDSLVHLEKVHEKIGDIPMVLYESTPQSFHDQSNISQKLIQIRPETCEEWGVNTAEGFIDAMYEHGFTGVCLDRTHLQRSPLRDYKTTIPILFNAGVIKEYHASAGRVDLVDSNLAEQYTLNDLSDLMNGTNYGDVIKQHELLNDLGWRGNIIFEILPTAILKVNNIDALLISKQMIIESYLRIRDRLYSIYEHPNGV